MELFQVTKLPKLSVKALVVSALLICQCAYAVEVIPAKRKNLKKGNEQAEFVKPRAIQNAYSKAERKVKNQLKKNWPKLELTSQNAWVDYADDLKSKRKIDFEANAFMVTLPYEYQGKRIDYPKMVVRLKKDLNEILNYTLADAINRDPLNQALEEFDSEQVADSELSKQVIVPELFSRDLPSKPEVNKLVERLVQNAYIKYEKLSALNSSVRVGNRATYVVEMPKSAIRKRATKYKPWVAKHAQAYDLPSELLFAVIHTESHFNPLARSRIPAYGLMQIVPYTAGKDASKVLYKRPRLLSAKYLYNPERNIRVGSVYLNLLYYKYLADIKSPKARLYCAIAAYNAGTTAVMKTLTGNGAISKSIDRINKMSDRQVYNKLVQNMPSRETRDYLRRVIKRQNVYAHI